jgi:hypothetical protein
MSSVPLDSNSNTGSEWARVRQLLQERKERIDGEKTNEMFMAIASGCFMPTRPSYFDICRKYSKPEHFALCTIMNADGLCPGHSDGSRSVLQKHREVEQQRETKPRSWGAGDTF